jgi:hypothetical protein
MTCRWGTRCRATGPDKPTIRITDERLERQELSRLVAAHFGDMVKIVVDVRREVVAVGGEY